MHHLLILFSTVYDCILVVLVLIIELDYRVRAIHVDVGISRELARPSRLVKWVSGCSLTHFSAPTHRINLYHRALEVVRASHGLTNLAVRHDLIFERGICQLSLLVFLENDAR